jgi:hypothetical protein
MRPPKDGEPQSQSEQSLQCGRIELNGDTFMRSPSDYDFGKLPGRANLIS